MPQRHGHHPDSSGEPPRPELGQARAQIVEELALLVVRAYRRMAPGTDGKPSANPSDDLNLNYRQKRDIVLRIVCGVLSAGGTDERARKHTAYDSNELNRRWTRLWRLNGDGLLRPVRQCGGDGRNINRFWLPVQSLMAGTEPFEG